MLAYVSVYETGFSLFKMIKTVHDNNKQVMCLLKYDGCIKDAWMRKWRLPVQSQEQAKMQC